MATSALTQESTSDKKAPTFDIIYVHKGLERSIGVPAKPIPDASEESKKLIHIEPRETPKMVNYSVPLSRLDIFCRMEVHFYYLAKTRQRKSPDTPTYATFSENLCAHFIKLLEQHEYSADEVMKYLKRRQLNFIGLTEEEYKSRGDSLYFLPRPPSKIAWNDARLQVPITESLAEYFAALMERTRNRECMQYYIDGLVLRIVPISTFIRETLTFLDINLPFSKFVDYGFEIRAELTKCNLLPLVPIYKTNTFLDMIHPYDDESLPPTVY